MLIAKTHFVQSGIITPWRGKEQFITFKSKRSINVGSLCEWIYDIDNKKVIKDRTGKFIPPSEDELFLLLLKSTPFKGG